MIEIVQIEVRPGTEKDFEAVVAKVAVSRPVKGHLGLELHRSIDKRQRYLLIAKWENADAHVNFLASATFAEWRALVGSYFASPSRSSTLR